MNVLVASRIAGNSCCHARCASIAPGDVLRLLHVLYLQTPLCSCHSNIGNLQCVLLQLRLLLLMLLPRPLSSNFGQARPWDVRCCCSSGCALQHDAAFLPQRCNNKFFIYWCSCDCCRCYYSRTLGVLGIGTAAAPSVALLVLPELHVLFGGTCFMENKKCAHASARISTTILLHEIKKGGEVSIA